MKGLGIILAGIALGVLTTAAEAAWIIRKVSAGGGATYIIDEDFEETGTPTANTWVDDGGTNADYDSTAHTQLTGEAMEVSSLDEPYVDPASAFDYVKMELEFSDATPAATTSTVGVRTSTGAALLLFRVNTSGKVTIFANGGDGTYSTTFTLATGTKYYLWLDWVPSGTSFVGISTTDSKPSSGTDTSTAWGLNKTAGSGTEDRIYFDWGGNSMYVDNLLADDEAI